MRKLFSFLLLFCFLLSNSQSFDCGTSTVTDIDGNLYHTVKIGSQCWLKENMKTTKYSNGQAVGISSKLINSNIREYVNMVGKLQVIVYMSKEEKINIIIYDISGRTVSNTDLSCNIGNNLIDISVGPTELYIIQIRYRNLVYHYKVVGSDQNIQEISLLQNVPTNTMKIKTDTIVLSNNSRYCFDYNNDPINGDKYGKLYTSLSALNVDSTQYGQPVQGICPDNWHVASDNDWIQLEIAAGMDSNIAIYGFYSFRGAISNKLKCSDLGYWYFNDGTDDFGFSARGSGAYNNASPYNNNGWGFYDLLQRCTWWTYKQDGLMIRQLTDFHSGVWRGYSSPVVSSPIFRAIQN